MRSISFPLVLILSVLALTSAFSTPLNNQLLTRFRQPITSLRNTGGDSSYEAKNAAAIAAAEASLTKERYVFVKGLHWNEATTKIFCTTQRDAARAKGEALNAARAKGEALNMASSKAVTVAPTPPTPPAPAKVCLVFYPLVCLPFSSSISDHVS